MSVGRVTDVLNGSGVRRGALAALAFVYALLWVGGVASHFAPGGVRSGQGWLASLFLLLAGMLVFVGAGGRTARVRLACVALFGFAVEVAGVRLGLPFGAYVYTDELRPALFGVPVVMACAWMALAAGVRACVAPVRLPVWAGALVSAVALTAIDLVIDPLAAGPLGYWRWAETGAYYGIPASNFLGWFVTGLCVFGTVRGSWGAATWARVVSFSITLFFTLLALAHALYAAALIGGLLSAAHFAPALYSASRTTRRTVSAVRP